MGADPDLACPGPLQGIHETGVVMAAVDECQALVMDGLQPQLQPEIGLLPESGQVVEHCVGQAVGAGGNDDAYHAGNRARLAEQRC